MRGYTLIEILISIAVLAAILVVTVGAMLNSMTASRKVSLIGKVENNGSWVLSEVRKNLLRASGTTVDCSIGVGDSLAFTSALDGGQTILMCEEGGKIASVSGASRVDLTEDGVTASECGNFISCQLPPSVSYPIINVNFTLSAGTTNVGSSEESTRSFGATVVVRN